jgi:hypothetical protein
VLDIDTSGIDQFISELDAEQRLLNRYVNQQYLRLVEIVFRDILRTTPQWSGNLAANWFIGVNNQYETEQTIPEKDLMWGNANIQPHRMGDLNAIEISEARLEGLVFSYLDEIYIYNPTEIAPEVEAHTVYIRPVNLLDGRVAMAAYTAAKYEVLNPL